MGKQWHGFTSLYTLTEKAGLRPLNNDLRDLDLWMRDIEVRIAKLTVGEPIATGPGGTPTTPPLARHATTHVTSGTENMGVRAGSDLITTYPLTWTRGHNWVPSTPGTTPITVTLDTAQTADAVLIYAGDDHPLLTIDAVNAVGINTGAPDAYLVVQATGFNPLSLSPLAWYKADSITSLLDGGTVVAWEDSSGNGHDLTGVSANTTWETSILNSLPSVRFASTDGLTMATGLTLSGDLTVFSVAKREGGSGGTECRLLSTTTPATDTKITIPTSGANDGGVTNSFRASLAGVSTTPGYIGDAGAFGVGMGLFTVTDPQVGVVARGGSAWDCRFNGVDKQTGSAPTLAGSLPFTTVKTETSTGIWHIFEIIVFGALSGAEIIQIEDYLNSKYGLNGGGSGGGSSLSYVQTWRDSNANVKAQISDLFKLGLNVDPPLVRAHIVDTTEQLRLGYDASNYASFTTGSGGDLIIAPTGADTTITGDLTVTTALDVGGAKFVVNSTGNITLINNVITSWPGSQGAANRYLRNDGAGILTWAAVALTSGAGVTGTLPATNGGTGFDSYTVGDSLYADTTTSLAKRGIGSTGDVYRVAGGIPTWASLSTAGIAPNDAQYLTLATNTTLTVERVFTPGTGLSAVDGGAGSTYTLNLANTAVTPGTYGSASLIPSVTIDQQGRVTSATTFAITPATFYAQRASQSLTADSQAIVVTDGSPVTPLTATASRTISAAPTIANGRDGQIILLLNTGANNIIVQDVGTLAGSNLRLGATTRTLTPLRTVLEMVYDSTYGGWVERYFGSVLSFTGSIVSFTINIGAGAANSQNAEVGTGTTDTPTFAWTYVGVFQSGDVDVSAGGDPSTVYPATISAPGATLVGPAYNKGTSVGAVRTFTPNITVSGTVCTTPTATVTYINKRYIGLNTQSTQLNDTQIKALATNELNTSQYSSWAVTAGASDYVWIVLRSALTDPFFAIASTRAGFSPTDNDLPLATAAHVNASSFSENYDQWRSFAVNLGSVTVTTQSSAAENRRYWLATTSTGLLNDATINAAGTVDILTSFPISKTIAATGSNYAYFIFPSRLNGAAVVPYISVNGYIAGVTQEGTQSHRNIYGYLETYRQMRTNTIGLGNVSYTFTNTLPVNKTYGGPNSQSTALSSAQTIALDDTAAGSNNLTGAKYSSVTITTAAGEYAWYCYRSTYGVTTMNFGIDSERAGFTRIGTGTVSVTNEQGYVETFEQWRSDITNPTRAANRTITAQAAAFNNRVYMGPAVGTDPITTANIRALDDTASGTSVLASTVAGSYVVTIASGNYLWFCHPDAITDLATIKDNSTGFAVDGAYMTDVSHTNDSGYVETYRCWRSTNHSIFPTGGTVVVT